ncbi:MAG: hypothetical protein KJP00_15370 [Bacteroidia bacterium]|nr:hypothetical protein [Bacteroidia bacterium]
MSKSDQNLTFAEFEIQSKSYWTKLAIKALKGQSQDTLTWKVDDHLEMDPINTLDEQISKNTPLIYKDNDNNWLIGEDFDNQEAAQTNLLLVQALENGLDSPLINNASEIDILLKNIRVDYIQPFFREVSDSFILNFTKFIKAQNIDPNLCKGGIMIVNNDVSEINPVSLQQIKAISISLPKYFFASVEFLIDPSDIGQSLAHGIKNITDLLKLLRKHNIEPKIVLRVELDDDFLKNIAVLRSINIQLQSICKQFEIDRKNILLDVYIHQIATDIQMALIGATSKALSAIFGGVDRMTIGCEALQVSLEEELTRRVARNIHHILKMECVLHETVDPLQGSYTIEALTNQITNRTNYLL